MIRRSFNLGGIIRCVAWLLAGLAAWTVPTDVSASIGIERVALLAEGAAAPPADFRAARWRAGGQSGDIDGYADWFLLTLTRGDAELSTGAGPEARSWTWLAHAHGVTIAADATARPLDALLLELEQTVYDRAGLNAAAARAAALELDPADRRLVDLAWQRAAWRSRLGDLVLDHAAKPSPPLDDAVEAALAVVHALALIEAGQAADAVPLVDAVLSFNDLPAAPRVATIEARLLAVRLAQAQGDHARAVERVDQARDIARRLGGASQWLARVEFSAGQVASATDRRPEALAHQETARALALRYPGDHLDSVSILQAYSSALYRLGRFDESAQAQAAAAAMLGRIDAPVAVRASVSAWGATMLWRANRSREAIAEFRAVLALLDAEQLDNSTATAVRQNLATLLFERGDLAAAARLFDQALWGEHRLRPGTLDEVRVLVNAARNDDQLGRDELAADRYARADAILAKIAPTAQLRAYLASNWAEHLARMGQVDAARVRFEEAVGIARELDRDCYCAGPSLRDYAVFAADQGRHDEALRLLDEARAVLVQFDNGAAEQWSIDVQRADVLRRAGRAADAADLVAEPLASIARALPNTPLHAVALYTAGRIADAQGDATAARTSHCAAADVLDRIDVAREAPGLAAERFRARHADVYRACLDHMVDAGDADAAFRQFERLRVRSIAAEQSSRRLEYSGERDAVDRWRASIERLADVEERVRDPETGTAEASDSRSALTAARNDVDAARTVLRNEAPRAARWLVPELRTPVGLRTAMPADVLYVGWSVGEANTLLFISGRDVEPRVARLRVGRPELTAAVTRLRERILRRDPADLPAIREEAAALREMLFGTHVDLVARHPRLWLAADGPLLSLPFAVLYDADRGRWLIEDHDIAVVDSLHLALPGSSPNHASTRWLVVADADSGDAERVALPAARREATAVAQAATAAGGEPALLVGAAATEAMVKRRAGNAGRLHFAVHSEVDAERPLESALLLGGGDGDDGALHVWEVYEQLALDADLVVLSSCSSALGRELRGQGLLGLARAFRHAGARRVVASLWPVEDSGTDVLMRRFYAHLTQGRPDAALRIAVVEQLGGPVVADASTTRGVGGLTTEPAPQVRLDHPYYWAGFQVY